MGKRIAEKWNLPPSLTSMVTLHHQPAFAKDSFEVTAVVHAADRVARKVKIGDAGDALVPQLAPEVQQWLNLPPPAWESIEMETCQKFEDGKEFLKAAKGN